MSSAKEDTTKEKKTAIEEADAQIESLTASIEKAQPTCHLFRNRYVWPWSGSIGY